MNLNFILTSLALILINVTGTLSSAVFADAGTHTRLDAVRERGTLRCGVNPELPGFSVANSLGEFAGLDIDLCRAVAAAVFDDPDAVSFVSLDDKQRFEALSDDSIDVLARNTTWTLQRQSVHGEFAGVNFYDGQAFMVPRNSGIRSAFELDNATVCVSRNTTSELNAIDFFKVSNMRYRPAYSNSADESAGQLAAGECQAFTTDRSALAAYRSGFENPAAYVVLPEQVSKEPLGPMVPSGDQNWANIVRWTLNCMINAEEMGITQANVNSASAAATPAARRLLGVEDNLGVHLSLDARWCASVIEGVGNYAESFDRHVGPDTALALDRGTNALWTNGGLLYAPPIR